MPPATRSAARARAAAAQTALPTDVLREICAFLPPGDVLLTLPRVSKALAAAAAPLAEGLRAEVEARQAWILQKLPAAFPVPLWALQEAWPQLRQEERKHAALRAAFHGNVAALRWSMRRLDPHALCHICDAAAAGGQLEALEYARAVGCPWSYYTCTAAARAGHLAVLQWARAQQPPCPWSVWTCKAAAEGGQLAVLQWLRAQQPPCPWDVRTCRAAAKGGQSAVLQWARAQRPPCPWNVRGCLGAVDPSRYRETHEWIRQQAALECVAL
jgi:hypothetical protein